MRTNVGLILKHGPRPWTRTLKNLDTEKVNPEKPEKQLDTEKGF